jgi:hypothetical protein
MEEMRPKVAVCIPHWGNVSLEWSMKMLTEFQIIDKDFDVTIKVLRGILNLDTERNSLVKSALQDPKVTHILFLDSDCITEENARDALRTLLGTDLPIVSGLYRVKQDQFRYPYAMWRKNGEAYETIDKWDGGNTATVDAIGFGFVLIKREVLEKIGEPWFLWNKAEVSEDWSACQKFIQYGYKIKVFVDVKLSHIGVFKLKCDGTFSTLDI